MSNRPKLTDQAALQPWERRQRKPRMKGLLLLADHLGCSHTHLGRVLRGERVGGEELRYRLAELGARFDAAGRVIPPVMIVVPEAAGRLDLDNDEPEDLAEEDRLDEA